MSFNISRRKQTRNRVLRVSSWTVKNTRFVQVYPDLESSKHLTSRRFVHRKRSVNLLAGANSEHLQTGIIVFEKFVSLPGVNNMVNSNDVWDKKINK